MRYLECPVTVIAPGTSANLGPGFDSFGLALSIADTVQAEVTAAGLGVDVVGEGAGDVPRDESHLVVRAMRAAFDAMGGQPPGLALRCRNLLPHGRGLGSSSAAIVGGIVAARSLTEHGADLLDETAALRLAHEMEGHPDNVAACLLGGLTLAWIDTEGAHAARLDVEADVVVFVPPHAVATTHARGLLPEVVSHADAAHNAGRAGLLVAALTGRRTDLLMIGTEDRLHQAYRLDDMPASLELLESLRSRRVPAVISGAGPSVLAFVSGSPSASTVLAAEDEVVGLAPPGWKALALGVAPGGAHRLG
ncbi:MAG: homoserine kinase [Nocardioidaceae bacterium]